MSTLRQALPQDEEGHFRQAIQCTICLNAGHSAVECNIRIYCPICHSKAHTVEQCKYNMINRNTPVVRRVETQRPPRRNDQRRQHEQPKYTDQSLHEDQQYRPHPNYNDYEEEEPEEEEYRGNRRYNKNDCRYDHHRPTHSRGGFQGSHGKYRQYQEQIRYDESSNNDLHPKPRKDQPQSSRHNRCPKRNQEDPKETRERHKLPSTPKEESSVCCFVCEQLGHYATQRLL